MEAPGFQQRGVLKNGDSPLKQFPPFRSLGINWSYRDKLSARWSRVNLIPHRHSTFSFSDFEYADGTVIKTEKEVGSAFVPYLQRLQRLYELTQAKYVTA
jgi:hypothetical protein